MFLGGVSIARNILLVRKFIIEDILLNCHKRIFFFVHSYRVTIDELSFL